MPEFGHPPLGPALPACDSLLWALPVPRRPMLKELRFSFQHGNCWLQEATERHRDLTLVVSSVYQVDETIHIDLFAHAPRPETVQDAFREWQRDARVKKISRLYEGPKGVRFHASYSAKNSIYPHIIHHTPVSLGAVSMTLGVEYYSLLGESEDVQSLLKVLGTEGVTKVLSIKNLQESPEPISRDLATELMDEFTEKQMEALILAHSEGYYNWPRELSASDLADRLGLSSAAFLDHLRRAESKALDMVIRNMRALDPARFEAAKARLAARSKAARKA